jgi:hypothetical protein
MLTRKKKVFIFFKSLLKFIRPWYECELNCVKSLFIYFLLFHFFRVNMKRKMKISTFFEDDEQERQNRSKKCREWLSNYDWWFCSVCFSIRGLNFIYFGCLFCKDLFSKTTTKKIVLMRNLINFCVRNLLNSSLINCLQISI